MLRMRTAAGFVSKGFPPYRLKCGGWLQLAGAKRPGLAVERGGAAARSRRAAPFGGK